jgi:imidazolonepropionase
MTQKLHLFRDIGELLTLRGAVQKKARHPVADDLSVMRKAAILQSGGKIIWAGEFRKIPKDLAREVVKETSLQGATVLPGLVESHTHLIFAGSRANEFEMRNQGMSYQEVAERGGGIIATTRPTCSASLTDLIRLGQERLDRFARQGVTTVEIKSGYALNEKDEIKILKAAGALKGPRVLRTFLGAHAIPKTAKTAAAYLDELANKVLPKLKKQSLCERVDIFIEAGYFDRTIAETYLRKAQALGFDIVMHADQLTHGRGAELACELSAVSADHLLNISDADVQALARSEVTCVLLPSADLYMNCPYPPARELLDAGARVALATDFNPGSSPSQDVSLVGVLARAQMKMSLPEVIVAYTLGGAYALNRAAQTGSIEAGKFCDLAVWDLPWQELFYEIGPRPPLSVWREGRALSMKPTSV